MQKPHAQGYPENPQTIGEHLKRKRMDLGMSQSGAARAIGVSDDCLCYWENGRNCPRVSQYPAIIAFLGYYPFDHETETFGGKIRRYKYKYGLSNEKLGKMLGVDEGTVGQWEKHKRLQVARSLENMLMIIAQNAAG